MESLDLAKDRDLLIRYTADECEKELLAIEGHGGKISDTYSTDGPIVGWCLFCVRKHLGYLTELSDECVKGCCYLPGVWRELRKWASENREKISQTIRGERSMSDNEIQELVQQARDFRKQMEKLVLGASRVSEPKDLR